MSQDRWETLRLRAGVSVVHTAAGTHLVGLPDHEPVTAQEVVVVRALAAAEQRADALAPSTAPLLARLRREGWLRVTAHGPGGPVHTLDPRQRPDRPEPHGVPPGLRLSRFTSIVAAPDGGLRVTSPRAWAEVLVREPATAAVLADPATERPAPGVDAAAWQRLRRDLCWAGLAVTGDEDLDFHVRQWSPVDLEFHRRSRGIGVGQRYGATYWGRAYAPPPAGRPPARRPVVALPRPDLDRLRRDDPTLTAVLEARRSAREHHDGQAITLDQLGEFLFRCARTVLVGDLDGVELRARPYPSGGGLHELEVYVVADRVAGLAAGTYHYDGHDHALGLVRPPDGASRRLLHAARDSAGAERTPQALLVVTARFGRLMWKYEGLAYALALKNLGVLVQTMYLAATAMGLGGCALGAGAPHAFTHLTGVDPLVEDVVGEFTLGTVAQSPR
ncbi:SagB family peptide dehydrogenase [Micromonospora sp. DT46]|uniref:SagB family peptide dehydrogenase n=1 Tax=unclassified Micromonospora TaxID=2617518 RepID=UPI0033D85807